jgi:hypothetical protein
MVMVRSFAVRDAEAATMLPFSEEDPQALKVRPITKGSGSAKLMFMWVGLY